ncbi:MAG: hypothetical protein U0796_06620 [Gemmatales bacterium]
MRSLYWLTAVTLVAAAVCTVAIADYSRRHPQGISALWSSSSSTITQPVAACPVSCSKEDPAPASQITIPSAPVTISEPTLPPIPSQTAVDLNSIPEHQQLREAALKNLVSMQTEVPTLPPASVVERKKEPVVDEFTYSDKPLAPLYVPIQPAAPVVLPPASIIKEVAKLPMIPGVSARNQTAASLNAKSPLQIEVQRGPQIMPGLHAAMPASTGWENPVQDTMNTVAELVAAMNPTTYLIALPVSDKKVSKATNFASVACQPQVKKEPVLKPVEPGSYPPVVYETTIGKDGKPVTKVVGQWTGCQAETPSVPTVNNAAVSMHDSTKPSCCQDEVIVRTYSVAEFTSMAGQSHEDLTRLITTMVAPESWNTKDSTIEYFPLGKCLVVRHRSAVQSQVEDLLTQLRSQVQKQGKSPVISRVPGLQPASELELVPVSPRETEQLPRVITIEPNRCVEDILGMIPMTPEGRLIPVPMNVQKSVLVPAQFETNVEPGWFFDGPAGLQSKPKAPEFFPWFLPYAPLPEGPATYEEQQVKPKGDK